MNLPRKDTGLVKIFFQLYLLGGVPIMTGKQTPGYMKTAKISLSLVASVIIFVACTEEEPSNSNKQSLKLKHIAKEHHVNNNLSDSYEVFFNDGKIARIETASGYKDCLYDGDLVKRIFEYNSMGVLESTTDYEYEDGKVTDRSITRKVGYSDFMIFNNEVVYGNDQIISIMSDNGEVFLIDSLSIGPSGLLKREEFYSEAIGKIFAFDYAYMDENVNRIVRTSLNDEITSVGQFEYLDIERTESSIYEYYLFGKEWKNNMLFENQYNFAQSLIPKSSKNHLSSYTISFYEQGKLIYIRSGEYEYEFDKNGNLLREVEYITFSDNKPPLKNIATYTYE